MEGGIIGPDFRQIYFVCEGQRAGTLLYTIKPKLSSYRKDAMFRGKIKTPFKNFLMGPNPKLTGNYLKFYGDRNWYHENGQLLFQLKVTEAVDAMQSKKQTSSYQPLLTEKFREHFELNNLLHFRY